MAVFFCQDFVNVQLCGVDAPLTWKTDRFDVKRYHFPDSAYKYCDLDDADDKRAAEDAWMRDMTFTKRAWHPDRGAPLPKLFQRALREMDIPVERVAAIFTGCRAWRADGSQCAGDTSAAV
jgi:hypothetical protein